MKILFLCGSLEPGQDGVGDYTRRLAGEVIRQGHKARIIALFDKTVLDITNVIQTDESTEIPTLRIPFKYANNQRFSEAKKWIDNFDPQWLSLQYVPFSFHDKGLHFGLSKKLIKLGKNKKWHIMFHELWVGMDVDATVKLQLWGYLQKIFISSIIDKIKPTLIHTQSDFYEFNLKNLKYKAEKLPLFGNIPVLNPIKAKNNRLTFIVFGSIHKNTLIKQFIEELQVFSKKNKVIPKFIFIGNSGSELENWLKLCAEAGFDIENLGFQSHQIISEVISSAKFGISTTPLVLAEKSGTTAAILEHNIPVISLRKDLRIKNYKSQIVINNIYSYKTGSFDVLFNTKINFSLTNNLQNVTNKLLMKFINSH